MVTLRRSPNRPTNRPRRRPRTRGQALVEFALILPVFLLVLSGILDFGFLLYSRMTVINSAREGARAAVTATENPTTIPSVAQAAAQAVATTLSGGVTVATTCVRSGGSCSFATATSSKPGDAVVVGVTYTYHTFFPLLFGTTIPLGSSVQMVME